MANPGKPYALKLITGSRRLGRPVATAALPLLQHTPAPPDWLLNAEAVREWHRLVPILMNCGLLNAASSVVLGHLCCVHGAICRTLSAGQQPRAAMVAQYRMMLNDFGLTPATARAAQRKGFTP
ncbi:hypothetical protein H010_00550 [Hydrogenophaga taeniospiralis CCUG 15921]|uniref:Uncharacterized protein n=1 Tax=Hydrogenophaga taeniospiralis CCUG 15921 TaxID=1281780 RepID=A0A9X4NM84_9BURK|nr:hypothetical protein [Hydrogenophaga taeniospiralis]MDG5973717.1 hypothetical protein [Hydrogenophaga taeniospiralis CCUG 15921]